MPRESSLRVAAKQAAANSPPQAEKKKRIKKKSINDLPYQFLVNVMRKLKTKDICGLRLISRRLNDVAKSAKPRLGYKFVVHQLRLNLEDTGAPAIRSFRGTNEIGLPKDLKFLQTCKVQYLSIIARLEKLQEAKSLLESLNLGLIETLVVNRDADWGSLYIALDFERMVSKITPTKCLAIHTRNTTYSAAIRILSRSDEYKGKSVCMMNYPITFDETWKFITPECRIVNVRANEMRDWSLISNIVKACIEGTGKLEQLVISWLMSRIPDRRGRFNVARHCRTDFIADFENIPQKYEALFHHTKKYHNRDNYQDLHDARDFWIYNASCEDYHLYFLKSRTCNIALYAYGARGIYLEEINPKNAEFIFINHTLVFTMLADSNHKSHKVQRQQIWDRVFRPEFLENGVSPS